MWRKNRFKILARAAGGPAEMNQSKAAIFATFGRGHLTDEIQNAVRLIAILTWAVIGVSHKRSIADLPNCARFPPLAAPAGPGRPEFHDRWQFRFVPSVTNGSDSVAKPE